MCPISSTYIYRTDLLGTIFGPTTVLIPTVLCFLEIKMPPGFYNIKLKSSLLFLNDVLDSL